MNTVKPVGVGTRTLNCLIDTIIIFTIAYFVNKGIVQYCITWRKPTPINFGGTFACVLFIYYFVFELIFTQSIGKFLTYSKVVSNNGKRPKIWQFFLRSILRITIIDLFFFPFLEENTLHDYLSGTKVTEKK